MFFHKKSAQASKKGFTLMELLVSISIITLIVTVMMVILDFEKGKSRDVKRQLDMKGIVAGLTLYYDKHIGYPNDTSPGSWEVTCLAGNDLQVLVADGFLPNLPCDPSNDANPADRTGHGYFYNATGCSGGYCSAFCLSTNLEESADTTFDLEVGGYPGCLR